MKTSNPIVRTALLAACIAATAPLGAAPAAAQVNIDGDDFAKWAACSFLGFRTSEAVVRREARQAGYRNIRNIHYVSRQRPNSIGCGFYRMRASRNGRDFVLLANAFSGQVEERRPVGTRDRFQRRQMTEAQARRALGRMGYGDIRNLTYRRDGRRDYYQARVVKGRGIFVVRIADENGQLISSRRVGTLKPEHRRVGLNEQEIRRELREDGYRRITGIDYVRRGNRDFYVAKAWHGRVHYRLRIDDQSGKVVNRAVIGRSEANRPQMNEAQVRRALQRHGYRRIADIDYVRRGRNDFYTATAWKGRVQYRLRVNDQNGAILGSTRIDSRPRGDRAEMNPRQIETELRRDGYRRIDNVRYVDRGRNDFYVAHAWYQGVQYRLVVSDENGDVVSRRRMP